MSACPKVSIIIPSYNHHRFVEKIVMDSLSQTYPSIEILVIDDGSKDGSQELLAFMSEKYGFFFKSQKNQGLAATLNKLVEYSSGEFICCMASDDRMQPDKISLLMEQFVQEPKSTAVVCGNIEVKDQFGNVNEVWFPKRLPSCVAIDSSLFGSFFSLLGGNYIPYMGALIRRQALLDVGGFTVGCILEDYDLWMRLSTKYNFKYLDEIVASYTIHDSNMSRDKKNKLPLVRSQRKILQSHFKQAWSRGFFKKWLRTFLGIVRSEVKECLLK